MTNLGKAQKQKVPIPGRRCSVCKGQIYRIEEWDDNLGWIVVFNSMFSCHKAKCRTEWKRRQQEQAD